jgi:hypothetical protein
MPDDSGVSRIDRGSGWPYHGGGGTTFVLVLFLLASFGQEFTYDINGRRVPNPSSINGNNVDTAKVEEKVLEDAGGRKVIERVIRRAGADGAAGDVERVRIEEVKSADGRVVTHQETYRSDFNGRMALTERSQTDFRKTGDSVESTTTVSRAGINGGLELVEKAVMSGRDNAAGKQTDTRIFRKDTNGGFQEAARTVTEQRIEDGRTVENVSEYQAATADGRMRLSGQRVTTELKSQDGATTKKVQIYGANEPSRPVDASGGLKLKEEQLIEQRTGAGKTVHESFSVRRPDLNGGLPGQFTKVSERTCKDKCQ